LPPAGQTLPSRSRTTPAGPGGGRLLGVDVKRVNALVSASRDAVIAKAGPQVTAPA
jgi:hypothetical protein